MKKRDGPAVEFEVFLTVSVQTDTHRSLPKGRIDVFFPHIRRLQNVSVGVNNVVVPSNSEALSGSAIAPYFPTHLSRVAHKLQDDSRLSRVTAGLEACAESSDKTIEQEEHIIALPLCFNEKEGAMAFNPKHSSHIITEAATAPGRAPCSRLSALRMTIWPSRWSAWRTPGIETMPCNFNQRRLADKVKQGVRGGRRHAHGDQYHLHQRRGHHGDGGHESLPRQPRSHCRLD